MYILIRLLFQQIIEFMNKSGPFFILALLSASFPAIAEISVYPPIKAKVAIAEKKEYPFPNFKATWQKYHTDYSGNLYFVDMQSKKVVDEKEGIYQVDGRKLNVEYETNMFTRFEFRCDNQPNYRTEMYRFYSSKWEVISDDAFHKRISGGISRDLAPDGEILPLKKLICPSKKPA